MIELQKQINGLLWQIKSEQSKGKNSAENENQIDLASVKKAYEVLNGEKLDTVEDCFKYFASINLLNAYVKKDYAETNIKDNYSFKKIVINAVDRLNKFCPSGVDFGASQSDKVIYLQVYDMQFSFHSCLPKNCNLQLKEMQWQNVRLQPYALEIFNLAMHF